jgi:PTS system nitrogen regulatory IIA component
MSLEKEIHVSDFLLPRHVLTDVRATDKTSLLQELARRAGAALNIASDTMAAALLKREQLGSTGMGSGIAIPHACLPEVQQPFGMLARLQVPVDFEAVDSQPVDLVFLLLVPEPSKGQQVNVLASVARKLRDSKVREELRHAKDARAIYRLMTDDKG